MFCINIILIILRHELNLSTVGTALAVRGGYKYQAGSRQPTAPARNAGARAVVDIKFIIRYQVATVHVVFVLLADERTTDTLPHQRALSRLMEEASSGFRVCGKTWIRFDRAPVTSG